MRADWIIWLRTLFAFLWKCVHPCVPLCVMSHKSALSFQCFLQAPDFDPSPRSLHSNFVCCQYWRLNLTCCLHVKSPLVCFVTASLCILVSIHYKTVTAYTRFDCRKSLTGSGEVFEERVTAPETLLTLFISRRG